MARAAAYSPRRIDAQASVAVQRRPHTIDGLLCELSSLPSQSRFAPARADAQTARIARGSSSGAFQRSRPARSTVECAQPQLFRRRLARARNSAKHEFHAR